MSRVKLTLGVHPRVKELWITHNGGSQIFFAMEPFDIIGNITEPLFKMILVTIKKNVLFDKANAMKNLFLKTAFRHAILEYIHKIGCYVRNSLRNFLRMQLYRTLTLLRGTHFKNHCSIPTNAPLKA